MSQRPIAEIRTWVYLLRVVARIERRLAAQLEQHDLTPAQFDVLVQLQRTPDILQQQLADQMLVSKGNVVGLLNRMERAGLVKRQAHPEDGRAYLLCLTEQGATLAAEVIPEHEALVAEYLTLLPPQDRRSLHDVLRKLDRALRPE
jgi:DNA-binding MarR family transcriptional regulator